MTFLIPTELVLTCISGFGTVCGGLLVFYLNPKGNDSFGDLEAACAGIMTIISIQLIVEGLEVLDLFTFLLCFVCGFASLFALNVVLKIVLPKNTLFDTLEEGLQKKQDDREGPPSDADREVLLSSASRDQLQQQEYSRLGLICFISMFAHNLPEGISVALSAKSDLALGIQLAIAIFLHNILEGMVVALPIWFESKSATQVILWTFLNGAAEPLGVLLCWFFAVLFPMTITLFIPKVLTAVSGLMIALSFMELLPHSQSLITAGGWSRTVRSFIYGFLGGGLVMYMSKQWIDYAALS